MKEHNGNASQPTSLETIRAAVEQHYIVAIGASAGGLEAIHEFFDNTGENSNVSFIVIQHLSPDYKSLLVELVSKHTHMRVFEAEHDMHVHRNCVYVIPNNKLMTIKDGKLRLSDKLADKGPNTAIDTFLYSLAKEKGGYAIAVILSGTGSDGTKGAEAVKRAGGLVLAQEPGSARFDGMPNSIIGSGNVDYILPPQDMPEEIFEYIRELPIHVLNHGKIDERLLEEIFRLVYKESGHDFNYYKTPTIIRRVARRMLTHGFKRLEEYISYLNENPGEAKILSREFLIGVTKFFRDPAAFELLYSDIFPEIIARKAEGEIIKIWVSACSTGEEAYSLAILLDKYLRSKNKLHEVKIFATDIDANAIEVAARAYYPHTVEKDIPEDVLKEYFSKEANGYLVTPRIRKQIVFARHNITKDPPFIKNDLASCRNMLIYMNSVLQRKVMSTLHFSLNPDGFLLLGPSESATSLKDNLVEVNSKWKIYRRNGVSRVQGSESVFKPLDPFKGKRENNEVRVQSFSSSFKQLADDFREVLADEYGFAAFYIDSNYEIKESLGDFRKYLVLPEKKLQLNLLKMVPPELSVALNTAIRKALQEQRKVFVKGVRIKEKHKQRYVTVTIKPGNPYLLVVLGEVKKEYVEAKAAVDFSSRDTEANKYIMDLEVELKQTRGELQMAIEGLETANEELQSSNEELLSANEELQSSNEELQSLNEELHTLNTEHQLKIKELIELNDDLNNYFRSTEIGQVFLDNQMRIRKFNPAAVNLINLIDSDLGRPISHISTNLQYENLLNDIEYVIDKNHFIEKEIQMASGKKTLMRILPYVRQDKKVDGVVISFVDISALRDLDNIVKGVFNTNDNAIMVFRKSRTEDAKAHDYEWVAANHKADKLIGLQNNEYIGKKIGEVLPGINENEFFLKFIRQVNQQSVVRTEHAFVSRNSQSWFDVVGLTMKNGLLVVTLSDITEKKQSEEKLRNSFAELKSAKDKLAKLNEELEDKIKQRTQQLSESNERFRLVSKATNEAIWDWDLVHKKVWWSDSFYHTFGLDKNNLTGKGRESWASSIHPDDRLRVTESLNAFIRSGNSNWSEEYDFLHGDGSYVRVLDRAYILHDEHGVPYRLLGSMLDVTQLRKAQLEALLNIEQRNFMAESMPLIVWSASPGGEIDFLNQQFYNYSGYTRKTNLQENWNSIIHPDDLPALQSIWEESFKSKKDFSVELRLRRADGQYCWHLLRARSKRDQEGNVISWIGTSTDVHEQKTYRETLEQKVRERTRDLELSNQELEASNIELQQFASVASHDLKEPLRKIHMFSHLVKDKYHAADGDPATEYLDRIINSSARMTNLVNDLLTFSRLSINQLFRLTDMNKVVDEVLGDLELLIKEKDAEIKVGYLPQLEAIPGQIRQVFQNILTNALKFSKKNEQPYISIESQCLEEKRFDSPPSDEGNYCMISIADNGIGFDEQYTEKIFTIFQRLHTKEKYEGTGIGLAITKKIIDKHNGIITAKSEDGKGSCFQFILPIRQELKRPASSR